MKSGFIFVTVVLLASLLSACGGWHLRGQGTSQLGDASVYVQQSRASALARALRNELRNRGVKLAGSKDIADVVVYLESEKYDRRVVSVDPDNGKVREIELTLETQYSVRDKSGTLVSPEQRLSWRQDYVFDEGSVLGTNEQEQTIQRELAVDAARTVLLRLETLAVAQ